MLVIWSFASEEWWHLHGQTIISLPSASGGPGFARVDFVVIDQQVLEKEKEMDSSWVGGGDIKHKNWSFIIPDGTMHILELL